MENKNVKLSKMYKYIFPKEELEGKERLWKVLIDGILQKYIKENDTVLDIGGGQCLFINNVRCGKKYAVDLNPDIREYANQDVVTIQESANNVSSVPDESVDLVFASNFFEHMKDKDELEKVIEEIKRILAVNGLLLIIQPNIRYAYKEYWDVIDHYTPISDKSLTSLLEINDFQIKICYPRFLPWSPITKISNFTILLKIYLRIPLLWRFFGKQMFIAAQKLPENNIT
ncbi:MAG: class I SAM-dependent methyltransferase [Nitrospirae bacterium]|nr:class I SAM-dependent methyltransferase [Nitrospirota bacterium]